MCAPGSATPAAVALTTWIGPDAVHVAQIAVTPDRRRQGLARVVMQSVLRASARAGATRMTLMVDGGNTAAVRLYESLGFSEGSRMIFGSRAARTRAAA